MEGSRFIAGGDARLLSLLLVPLIDDAHVVLGEREAYDVVERAVFVAVGGSLGIVISVESGVGGGGGGVARVHPRGGGVHGTARSALALARGARAAAHASLDGHGSALVAGHETLRVEHVVEVVDGLLAAHLTRGGDGARGGLVVKRTLTMAGNRHERGAESVEVDEGE